MAADVYQEVEKCCLETQRKGERLPLSEMLMRLMDLPEIPMHHPYHHVLVPCAILTQAALERGVEEKVLQSWLTTAKVRAKQIPGGVCGEWGACGAGVGVGIAVSVLTGASPKSEGLIWGNGNGATAQALQGIAKYGGPRCCKRTSFLAVKSAIPFINRQCGLHLTFGDALKCKYFPKNQECLRDHCPFFPRTAKKVAAESRE